MKKLLRCDFHCHPLCHKYYPNKDNYNDSVKLSRQDKEDIRTYIHWCIDERKLDVTAITDHDLIQSSLYAKAYVKEHNLPIKIVTGAEVEIYIQDDGFLQCYNTKKSKKYRFREYNYCHILVLGVSFIPNHKSHMTELEFKSWADEIRDIGGIVVMSHPLFSVIPFYTVAEYLDGFESINRDTFEFFEGIQYADENNLSLKTFTNSDYHYYKGHSANIPININLETEEFINKLLW